MGEGAGRERERERERERDSLWRGLKSFLAGLFSRVLYLSNHDTQQPCATLLNFRLLEQLHYISSS